MTPYWCAFHDGEFVTARREPFPPESGEAATLEIVEAGVSPGPGAELVPVGGYRVARMRIDPMLVVEDVTDG